MSRMREAVMSRLRLFLLGLVTLLTVVASPRAAQACPS